jgi:hypothetical protein
MASFQKFEEGMNMVYDYAIFVDINKYDDFKEYVFYSMYNDSEFYMTPGDRYSIEHNDFMLKAFANAHAGVCTFAEIAITSDDNWICQIYTPEEIKTLISENDYKQLTSYFDIYIKRNIEKQRKFDSISKEIEKVLLNNSATLIETIGDWKHTKKIYGDQLDTYVDKMRKDCAQNAVVFPFNKFIANEM